MTSNGLNPVELLRNHRPFLLLCEAIGLFHMAGKAKIDFLKYQAGEIPSYDYKGWAETENIEPDLLSKILGSSSLPAHLSQGFLPGLWRDLVTKHADQNGTGLLGLLQAAHGMASGIEKQSYASKTVEYLAQTKPDLWLSSAFGTPERNLLSDPPSVLTSDGWNNLIGEIKGKLKEANNLKNNNARVDEWFQWRNHLVGPDAFVRKAFLSTLAETRLPNNDVTLWDQSYIAAALFKSAIAGALLDSQFSTSDKGIKSKVRWRLLTIGIGSEYYEARAVKIGDWTGTARILEEFFEGVQRLIEVDLALGSLIYRDTEVCIFTFPGESKDQQSPASWIESQDFSWQKWLENQTDDLAHQYDLETPPYCFLSAPTRSLVPIVKARHDADHALSVPVHRYWLPRTNDQNSGHVCPVCGVRQNSDPTNKDRPCEVCLKRRSHRLQDWLNGESGSETIWLDEVADSNDRIALITLQLDVEPWLEGERIDSLRAQAIPDWLRHNANLGNVLGQANTAAFMRLHGYIQGKLSQFNQNDNILAALNQGFKSYQNWQTFFEDIVEDRTKEAPKWASLTNHERAIWLSHQLFRKLPSPGRTYRFWRQSEDFFKHLYKKFSEISSKHPNRWRLRRLAFIPENTQKLQKNHLYEGLIGNQTCSFLFDGEALITASNLARFLLLHQTSPDKFQNTLTLKDAEKPQDPSIQVKIKKVSQDSPLLQEYLPIITLELSPLRFRILVSLETASKCVDVAIREWRQQFACVQDRLPLNIGVVVFPSKMSFQAVIEMARTIEHKLTSRSAPEKWTVKEKSNENGQVRVHLHHPDNGIEKWEIPTDLPDGRKDVFYPYLAMVNSAVQKDRDFQTPNGTVYRHAEDVSPEEEIRVYPSKITTVFLDTTVRRFESPTIFYLRDWETMRDNWELLSCSMVTSQLQMLRAELLRLTHQWRIEQTGSAKKAAEELLRVYLRERLPSTSGEDIEKLLESFQRGVLLWTIDWHLSIAKEK
ncbi:CRISPR-associated protein, Csx11 family [Anaerolinea thermolimosa]|nr:CRISPR-associated protein, Csx11 family [Anaerolinea thermolimosa]